MKFHPSDKKIREIFSSSNVYQIPNFQRDFSWESSNFEDFLNDLLTASQASYDADLEGFKLKIKDVNSLEDYFFGTFLVVGDYSDSSTIKEKVVVDGQQRLTTMTIFLAAIRDLIEDIKNEQNLSYDHDYDNFLVVNIKRSGKSEIQARLINEKLHPLLPIDIVQVRDSRSQNMTPMNDSQELLLEKYNWFKNELSYSNLIKRISKSKRLVNIETYDYEKYLSFLDTLGYQLLLSTVIIIYSEDETSANIMYRNFNSRGMRLTDPDLIKNELFQALDDKTDFAKITWANVENNVHQDKNNLSTFFIHYFSSTHKGIAKHQIFDTFLKVIKVEDYFNFLERIDIESSYYKSIIKPSGDDELFDIKNYFLVNDHGNIKRHLDVLQKIEVIQVRSLLLGLFYARDNGIIKSKQFKSVIKNILLFQSLLVMTSSPSNNIRGSYIKYGREFRKSNITNSPTVIQNLFKSLLEKIPSESEILEKTHLEYSHKKINGKNAKKDIKNKVLIKLILTSLSEKEQSLTDNISNEAFDFIHKATLEHIIDESNESIGNRLDIGNLILLEQSKHHNDLPKDIMYSQSTIELTKNFSSEVKNFLGDTDIVSRRKNILTQYYDFVLSSLKAAANVV